MFGLKSKYISGYPSEGHGHAWNQVRIDGEWYNVDSTWDAKHRQKNHIWKHALKSDAEFSLSHGKFKVRNFHLPCKNSRDIRCPSKEIVEKEKNNEH